MKQLWQENKGSISLFATISIITLLMILFLSVNIGNIFAKKNLVQNTTDGIAPAILSSQLSRWISDDPTTSVPKADSRTAIETANFLISKLSTKANNNPLSGATLIPVFGIWNPENTPPFCAFKETCMSSDNQSISATDPNLNNVYLENGEDFAVAFQINYDVTPLGKILNFLPITLKGKALYKTTLSKITEDEDIEPERDCCCNWAAEKNGTKTIMWPMPPMCIKTNGFFDNENCSEWAVLSKIINDGGSQTCKDYMICYGTFFERLASRQLFSSFLEFLRCWFDQFVEHLIQTIEKIHITMDEAWDGWQ